MTPHFGNPAIPAGSLILVTGVNGFIASHVTDQLIQAGYRVRGTTRDTNKTEWMKEMFGDAFEVVVVKDMSADGAFDEACKGRCLLFLLLYRLKMLSICPFVSRRCGCHSCGFRRFIR